MNEFKRKAIQLREKFYEITCCDEEAKRCAIIVVYEILDALNFLSISDIVFWQEVKHELEKM